MSQIDFASSQIYKPGSGSDKTGSKRFYLFCSNFFRFSLFNSLSYSQIITCSIFPTLIHRSFRRLSPSGYPLMYPDNTLFPSINLLIFSQTRLYARECVNFEYFVGEYLRMLNVHRSICVFRVLIQKNTSR